MRGKWTSITSLIIAYNHTQTYTNTHLLLPLQQGLGLSELHEAHLQLLLQLLLALGQRLLLVGQQCFQSAPVW